MLKYMLGRVDSGEARSKENELSYWDLFPGIMIADDNGVVFGCDEDRYLYEGLMDENLCSDLESSVAYSYFSGNDAEKINSELVKIFREYSIYIPDFLLEKGGHGLRKLSKIFTEHSISPSDIHIDKALSLFHNKKYGVVSIKTDGKWAMFYYPLDYSEDKICRKLNAVKAKYYGTMETYIFYSVLKNRVVGEFYSAETTVAGVKNDFIELINPSMSSNEIIVYDSVGNMRHRITNENKDRRRKKF